MPTAPVRLFDPLFSDGLAERMLELCRGYGRYGLYSEEGTADDWGTGLPQRYDAALNFVRSGGRFGRREPVEVLAARTNYFRETYAYRDEIRAPGILPFHRFDGFVEGARAVHGRRVVRPAISYANLLVPGQELAVHTDVPEFRGLSRLNTPQWLLVAMHHSGLFGRWRMPIATAVAYFGSCRGGAFAYYPDGRDAPPRTLPARHNTAVLLDTDSVFHGVDRVAEEGKPLPPLRPGMQLVYEGSDRWRVGAEGGPALAHYRSDEIRFSVSWKAYCFADEAEERAAREHMDDLAREVALERLLADLRRRGRLAGEPPPRRELALLLIDEYVRFPAPLAQSA
jgi:hypothetical protein